MTTVVVQSSPPATIVVQPTPPPTIAITRTAAEVVMAPDVVVGTVQPTPARVVEIVARGPKGDKGDPGDASGAMVQRADVVLGGHRVVRSVGGDRVGYASAADPMHGDDTVGITLNAAAAGDEVTVVVFGPVAYGGWAWTPGAPVFLSTDGLLTQTPPEPLVAAFVQCVGHARDATTLYVAIDPPVYF